MHIFHRAERDDLAVVVYILSSKDLLALGVFSGHSDFIKHMLLDG